jgi:hypothetical protein
MCWVSGRWGSEGPGIGHFCALRSSGKKDTVIYFGAMTMVPEQSVAGAGCCFSKAKRGKGPRRGILNHANSGEGKGLWGSNFYTDHPLYPRKNDG